MLEKNNNAFEITDLSQDEHSSCLHVMWESSQKQFKETLCPFFLPLLYVLDTFSWSQKCTFVTLGYTVVGTARLSLLSMDTIMFQFPFDRSINCKDMSEADFAPGLPKRASGCQFLASLKAVSLKGWHGGCLFSPSMLQPWTDCLDSAQYSRFKKLRPRHLVPSLHSK